jgi:hypothetical protein
MPAFDIRLAILAMLYSPPMTQPEPDSREAAFTGLVHMLRAWGVAGLAAELLEGSGPLSFLGAQALYFTSPVLEPFGSGAGVVAWAELLEDPQAVQALALRLRRQQAGSP